MATNFDWTACYDSAAQLRELLAARGVSCDIYADRNGIPSVQVFLTADMGEGARSLMICTEGTEDVGPNEAVAWHGQFANFNTAEFGGANSVDLDAVSIRMIERPWLGHGPEVIADDLLPFIHMLRWGAASIPAES